MATRRSEPRHSKATKTTRRYQRVAVALGARVREERQAQELTLERAAERMGLDWKHLQKIESGTVNVTLVTLLRIADGLRLPIARLFERVE